MTFKVYSYAKTFFRSPAGVTLLDRIYYEWCDNKIFKKSIKYSFLLGQSP